jgi:hypothetical protein
MDIFVTVMKVIQDQHQACAHAVYEAAGAYMDNNLRKVLKQIPIIGICIVGYSLWVHVLFYLGDGIWVLDEVATCNLPNVSEGSLVDIVMACCTFLFIKVSSDILCTLVISN